jgi:hypothetical protein
MGGTGTILRWTVSSLFLFGAAVSAEAQTRDRAPVALQSSDKMTQDASGSETWTYAQPAERFSNYRSVIVEPAAVYQGPDAQFDDIDQADRARFAAIITDELRSELAKSFARPNVPQANTLRLRLTILGARKTTAGLATATRVTPFGIATSALKSALGRQGSLTGSVLYAVELFDAPTDELLLAAVRRRAPDALDVPATLSTTETIRAVARELADGVRNRLEALTGMGSN